MHRATENTAAIIVMKFGSKVVGTINKRIAVNKSTIRKSTNLSRKTQITDFPKGKPKFVLRYTPFAISPALIGIKKFSIIATPFRKIRFLRGTFLILEMKTFRRIARTMGDRIMKNKTGSRFIV